MTNSAVILHMWPPLKEGSCHRGALAPPWPGSASPRNPHSDHAGPSTGPADALSTVPRQQQKTKKKSYSYSCNRHKPSAGTLTFDCIDHTVAIFYQLFKELARPVQLQLVTFQGLSEVRTVQIAIAELQRRMPHLSGRRVGVSEGSGGGEAVGSEPLD